MTTDDRSVRRVLVLANSRKLAGRCVAGLDLSDESSIKWIRPVSSRPHGEVSERERQFENGADPRLLNLVTIPLLRAVPSGHQSENWLLDPERYWCLEGQLAHNELHQFVDQRDLWLASSDSTYHGAYDRVSEGNVATIADSLRLVRVDDLSYRVFAPGSNFGDPKRCVQASFTHLGVEYRMRVTDPIVEREYLALANGLYDVGAAFLTVSLAELWEGYGYKVVAAVLPS